MGTHPASGSVWGMVRSGFWPGHVTGSNRAVIIRDAGVAAQRRSRGCSGCFETRRRLAAMDRLRAGPYYRPARLLAGVFERSVIKRYPLKALIKTQALQLRRASFEARSCGSRPLFSLRRRAPLPVTQPMFEPPRATRDILPDQAAARNHVRAAFVQAAESYGFQENPDSRL